MHEIAQTKRTLAFRGFPVHIIFLIAICIFPIFVSNYIQMLATEALLLAVFAMSLDLIMGYAGIVSFGHAAFFGVGGYTLGVIIMYLVPSVWFALLAAAITCGILAFLIGAISIRTRGIYFAILTLAFAELIYRIVFHTYALGGSDGLIGIPVPNLNFGILKINLQKTLNFYYLATFFAYFSYLTCHRITESPFGRVLRGIRDNEDRISFLGFNTKHYKIIAFVISGIFAGWSGALYSLFKTFADTEQLHFMMSGKVIIMDLIGGMGTLIGPMFGAIFLTVFQTVVSSFFSTYPLIIGAIFVLVVIFLPEGFYGLFHAVSQGAKRFVFRSQENK